jgi:hypothetical protein
MSQRRSRPPRAKKSRTVETEALLNDVLDASAAAPMLSPPPSIVDAIVDASVEASLSIADELALVDAAWEEMLA